jgi:hypothetical protein
LTTAMQARNSKPLYASRGVVAVRQSSRSIKGPFNRKIHQVIFLLMVAAFLADLPVPARSQSPALSVVPSGTAASVPSRQLGLTYVRPTQRTMVRNYVFDAYGPYPIVGAAFTAGIGQFSNSPPEWNQDFEGYTKRFGSDLGIAAVGTTTRYGLAELFKEDTLYYRCECSGVFPRLRHAAFSTLTGRRGADGHRVFSFPALVAPYAGSMTAVYAWYPNRFGAKDAFRIGNYSLLAYAGENISLEFMYSGPHSLLARMHLNNAHGSPVEGPNKGPNKGPN